jgi:geranylgeranyl diphosphate synthase type I
MATLQQELQRIGGLMDRYLEAELTAREPANLWQAAYHLPKAGGKRIRPFLTVTACKALGGHEEDALPPAAAIELIQAFSLVHDDIIDNDDLRRGVPTVHKKWGIPTAIVAGDLLHIKSYDIVTKAAMKNQRLMKPLANILDEINKSTIDICEGQELDEDLERNPLPSEEDYLRMISKKTAALFKCSTVVGALSAGSSSNSVELMRCFGDGLGMSFQIVDDILGLTADEKELGKPVGSDLREGKRTILVIHALAEGSTKEKKTILKALGNARAAKRDFAAATKAITSTGALEYSKRKAQEYSDEAKKALLSIPESNERKLLDEVLAFIVERRY